jgi:ketosteroid isomerase-like protein
MARSLSFLLSVVLLPCCPGFAQSDPAQAPPVANGVTSADSSEIAQFQKIEDSWSNAVNARDQYALELVLSPLFVDIAASGDITTRNQQLAAIINLEDKTLHLEQRAITVRMLGDTSVVNGTYTLRHKVGPGPVDERGIFTHVFSRHRNGWLCINSQRTVLREDTPGSKKKKPSDAEQPFHIPLFSKGSDKKDQ